MLLSFARNGMPLVYVSVGGLSSVRAMGCNVSDADTVLANRAQAAATEYAGQMLSLPPSVLPRTQVPPLTASPCLD